MHIMLLAFIAKGVLLIGNFLFYLLFSFLNRAQWPLRLLRLKPFLLGTYYHEVILKLTDENGVRFH